LFVEHRWFERFILLCIVINSILLAIYQQRATPDEDHYWINEFIDNIADHVLWGIFALECLFKLVGYGLICGPKTYLRDPWNVLDFVVVVSGLLERCNLGGSLSFLRLFRLLRPLRSLNSVPQMKVLVNTTLSSMLKLGNVIVLGAFLFMVFGIIGIQLMGGIFYQRCHVTQNPTISANHLGSGVDCWSWEYTEDDRLCGGNYNCEASLGFCGGHEKSKDIYQPQFPGGKGALEWCVGSEPGKLYPETDFVHFDHIGAALLLIFQCMTLEGWTDLMYIVEDAFSPWFAVLYFISVVLFTNFFMLNVALAVVDEVQDEFREQALEEADEAAAIADAEQAVVDAAAAQYAIDNPPEEVEDDVLQPKPDPNDEEEEEEEPEPELWWDCKAVRCCNFLATNETFGNFIMTIITGNVINMCVTIYSMNDMFGHTERYAAVEILEITFLSIFIVEMFIMLTALGPKGYIKNPITAFDGFVVCISIIELVINKTSDGGGGALSALRTFRLFRVMNKLANKWSKLKVLLKAMLHTGMALNYWLILFGLVLYIFTLMWIFFFGGQFQFDGESVDDFGKLTDPKYADNKWCPEEYTSGAAPWVVGSQGTTHHFKQDCIPRAHFDTFTWGFVAVFQVMTGENWNTIMYAGMRASERWEHTIVPPTFMAAMLFVVMILFGQTLFLSLFLSMLISKFDEVSHEFDKEEEKKKKSAKPRKSTQKGASVGNILSAFASGGSLKVAPAADGADSGEEQGALSPSSATNESALPGRLPDSGSSPVVVVGSDQASPASQHSEDGKEKIDEEAPLKLKEIPSDKGWPHGYACFIFSNTNPIRDAAKKFMVFKLNVGGSSILLFDNFILCCIILSTLCMMMDTPLSPPDAAFTKILRGADRVFAVIFIIEMTVKLLALGIAWGEDAYLKSGWNWLDGIVVCVSIVDIVTGGKGPGFLRVLRILRTFRPLRVISRNEGLRLVVQTIFHSLGDLFGLVIVSSLFLLIFALIFVMYLRGTLYQCSPGDTDVGYLGPHWSKLGTEFVTPLCIGSSVRSGGDAGSVQRGSYDKTTGEYTTAECVAGSDLTVDWQRASADTPICVARCSPYMETHKFIKDLCADKYTTPEELPSQCESMPDYADGPARVSRFPVEEARGVKYVADMTRAILVPCGGSQVQGGAVVQTGLNVSCKENFCPKAFLDSKGTSSETCKSDCKHHNVFCRDTCKGDSSKLECVSCLMECEAACMCEDFCMPLSKDAALCHEQGGTWEAVLSQNFDNILNAMVTLFEISTTEGWVDVMYAASDAVGIHRQPLRDSNHGLFVFLFPLWILLSFMFLINLAVGVIVDTFMRLKDSGSVVLLTPGQKKWVNSRLSLHSRSFFFDLTDVHLLKPFRRSVYDFISCKPFENFIMGSIVFNTLIMALTSFPAPTDWWNDAQMNMNRLFAVIYTVEAVLKLYALRSAYWQDSWNVFDFTCVMATIGGLVLKFGLNIDLGAATSVVRIMRIARLFRLLRFLKELNRLFMCLLISIPKLVNVTAIMLLFLILFSILGMSLFGTSKFKDDPTLNVHGNFQTFWRSFVTLFRAATGEAWNEVMHDLAMDEEAFFRAGTWCAPQGLFRSRLPEVYEVLNHKCLIEQPNACPGSWNPMPAIFWVFYTLLLTFMILNLVVAVILEGYEEGKSSEEGDNIDMCIEIWKKYDPEHRMSLPLKDALGFIDETIHAVCAMRGSEWTGTLPKMKGSGIYEIASALPMKLARAMCVTVTPDGRISFISASRQVLRFTSLEDFSDQSLKDIDKVDDALSNKDRAKLKRLEPDNFHAENLDSHLAASIAAIRLQRRFRAARAAREGGACGGFASIAGPFSPGGSVRPAASREDSPEERQAAGLPMRAG
jgi:hypothetical protein